MNVADLIIGKRYLVSKTIATRDCLIEGMHAVMQLADTQCHVWDQSNRVFMPIHSIVLIGGEVRKPSANLYGVLMHEVLGYNCDEPGKYHAVKPSQIWKPTMTSEERAAEKAAADDTDRSHRHGIAHIEDM